MTQLLLARELKTQVGGIYDPIDTGHYAKARQWRSGHPELTECEVGRIIDLCKLTERQFVKLVYK